MSEIFDFLKKTDGERRKKASLPKPMAEAPVVEPAKSESKPIINQATEAPVEKPAKLEEKPVIDRATETPVAFDSEIQDPDRFDLALSAYQLRSVLDPLTIVGEQFRLLRTRLGLMQKQNGIKTVLVTSTVPQEGKTFTSYGLAGVIAQEQNKRVVVIDADMRKRGSGRDLGLNGNSVEAGLAQVLQGSMEFQNSLLTSVKPEFSFLPAGSLPTNPSELLSSPNMERILKSAAESFDWVIIDSPPILALSDATLLAPLCDTVLLVVKAKSTQSKLVLEIINRIGRERICGIVINRQKQLHTSRYYYQYYYQKSKPPKQ